MISKNNLLLLVLRTAEIAETKQDLLRLINWKNGESNLDYEFSLFMITCCYEAFDILKEKYFDGVHLKLNPPDILCEFKNNNNNEISKVKIELKTSISDKMPGSTIMKTDINMPFIFCKKPKDLQNGLYELRCTQYHDAIVCNDNALFLDRTPRPIISFAKMPKLYDYQPIYVEKEKYDVADHFANCAINRMNTTKYNKSFQDDLIKKLLEKFIKNTSINDFIKMKENIDKLK